MTKHVMTQATTIALADKLRSVCNKVNGYAVYHEGWSDKRLTETMTNLGVTSINVANLRKILIGEIRVSAPVTLEQRCLALEVQVAHLVAWASARPVQPFKLD